MIYEPEKDSYLLEKYVKKYAKGRVLDVGTGSGIQALATLDKAKEVIAIDIDEEAIEFVKKKGVMAFCSDLFENVGGKFDLIVFNPPYLPRDSREDKESQRITTGGKEGHEVLERFLKDAKKYLAKNGKILIVFSSLTGDVVSILKKYQYKFECLEIEKMFFEELYVYLIE